MSEDVGVTISASKLLNQCLMNLRRGTRRRQFLVGYVDLALGTVKRVDDFGDCLFPKKLGAGKGELDRSGRPNSTRTDKRGCGSSSGQSQAGPLKEFTPIHPCGSWGPGGCGSR